MLAVLDGEIAILKHKIYELDIHRSDDDHIGAIRVGAATGVTPKQQDVGHIRAEINERCRHRDRC